MHTPSHRFAVCALFVCFCTVGCGGDGANRSVVSGKLLDNGMPFVLDSAKLQLPKGASSLPPGSRPLQVSFISSEGNEQFSAIVNPDDGTFKVPGNDGKGIKPGRYKIAVTASAGGGGPDYFGGKFSSERTGIVRDVKEGEEVVIDLAKP